ncbi:MAG: glycosyltransferase family 4 protein [Bacteroidota bacterium]
MKIGMILDNPFPPDPRVENEAVTLIQQGHEVFLYCLDYSQDQAAVEEVNGIQVRRFWVPTYLKSVSALAYTIPYYHNYLHKSIREFLEKEQIDVIHVHDMQIARAVFRVNEKLKKPLVLDLHENRPEIMKFYTHVQSGLGQLTIYPSIWKKREFQFIRAATKTVVVTEEAKAYYVAQTGRSPQDFIVVPNTVRKAFYQTPFIDAKIVKRYRPYFTLLYLGDTGERRGLKTVVEAMQYILPEIPEIRFVCVGKSKSDPQLKAYIRSMGVEEQVEMAGWQDFRLFQSYIEASSICVSPLHRNLHHDTTFANKVFQYLSLRKPVIVSNCPSQENLIHQYDCGLVFQERDAADFAEQVLKLYKDAPLRKRLGENGRRMVEQHMNWDISSTQLNALYRDFAQKIG